MSRQSYSDSTLQFRKPLMNYKWELLALLWIAFFLNQADRQIFSIVLSLIKVDLHLTDGELGLIASALVCTYGVLVPIAGFIGDAFSRKNVIGYSLFFWSIATLCTGMCSTLISFVLLRGVATGGGEAFYAPAANSLISEEHKKGQSLALSIHQTAVYFGIILSGLITGYVAEHFGWRNAFYLFGGLGILIAAVIFRRLKKDQPKSSPKKSDLVKTIKEISAKPTIYLLTGAFGCMVFVNVGYLTWMPSLLVDKFKLSLTDAGFSSMFYHHFGAFFGVLIGGAIADKLSKGKSHIRLWIQALALLCGAPFIYAIGMSDTPFKTYTALLLFGVFRGIYDSNIFASLYQFIKPEIKSTASGLMLMIAFLIGAFSPLMLGLIKPIVGLSKGLSLLWISYVLGAFFIIIAILFFIKKDHVIDKESMLLSNDIQ